VACAGHPADGDPIEEVLTWHAENRVTVAIAVGQEALHLPLLLGFVTGLHGLVGRRGGAGAAGGGGAGTGRAWRWPGARLSRRSSRSTPFWGSESCCPPASSPSRARRSFSPGSCLQQRSRWRCRRSAPPSSALRWRRMRAA